MVRLAKGSMAGSGTDLGLGIGGRVKLIRSSAISLFTGVPNTVQSFCFDAGDPSRFFTGTANGGILHTSRFRTKVSPREFHTSDAFHRPAASCLASNKLLPGFLLAGFSDGSLAVFETSAEDPLVLWDDTRCLSGDSSGSRRFDAGESKQESVPSALKQLVWSETHPAVFLSLDAGGSLRLWNLLESVAGPVKSVSVDEERGPVDSVAMRRSHVAGAPATLAICYRDGNVSLVEVTLGITESTPAEVEKIREAFHTVAYDTFL